MKTQALCHEGANALVYIGFGPMRMRAYIPEEFAAVVGYTRRRKLISLDSHRHMPEKGHGPLTSPPQLQVFLFQRYRGPMMTTTARCIVGDKLLQVYALV